MLVFHMRLLKIFLAYGAIFCLLFVGLYLYLETNLDIKHETKSIENHVEELLLLKSDQITQAVELIVEDVERLSSAPYIGELLNEENIAEIFAVKKEARVLAQHMVNKIEKYLNENPEMTIKDLQSSKEFNEIVSSLNEDSLYIVIGNSESPDTRYFHPNPNAIGTIPEIIKSDV